MAVGARIQQLRESANLTVEQVANATKIRKDLIKQIEAEDWKSLDLPVFIRNQIRLIANALNADETELLELFETDFPESKSSAPRAQLAKSNELNIFDKHGIKQLPAKRSPYILYLIIGMVAVVAIAVFAFLSNSNSENTLPQTDVTISKTSSPSPSSTETSTPTSNILGVSVVLEATGRSWITANGSSGNSLFSSFINAGETITLTDSSSISLVIGDAGFVNVTVNDENLGYLGGPGSPVEISFPIQ